MKYLDDVKGALTGLGFFDAVEILADHSMALTLAPEQSQSANDPARWSGVYIVETGQDLRENVTLDIIIAVSSLDDKTGAAATVRRKEAQRQVRATLHFKDFGDEEYYFEPVHRVDGHLMGFDQGVLYWDEQYQLRTIYHED